MINTRSVALVGLVALLACESGGPLWPEGEPPIRTDATVYTLETNMSSGRGFGRRPMVRCCPCA